jgi:hypothetical protein
LISQSRGLGDVYKRQKVTVPVLVGRPAVYLKSVAGIVVVPSLWVNAVIIAVAVQLEPAEAPLASVTVTAPISRVASDGEATVPKVPDVGAEILNPPPATVKVTVVDAAWESANGKRIATAATELR